MYQITPPLPAPAWARQSREARARRARTPRGYNQGMALPRREAGGRGIIPPASIFKKNMIYIMIYIMITRSDNTGERWCKRCGGVWLARVAEPRCCPHCKSPYWRVERQQTGEQTAERTGEQGEQPMAKTAAKTKTAKTKAKAIAKTATAVKAAKESGGGNGAGVRRAAKPEPVVGQKTPPKTATGQKTVAEMTDRERQRFMASALKVKPADEGEEGGRRLVPFEGA